ncbi:MAG: hypothetical protein CVU41_07275 [Chloroflexi bacterium HGW-Chloroflexi-3]|nr:MAG: hypothetical protein CVU41_07275 [Chloroflexi bacterium HGW-Chloroflexi-3]
MTPEEPIKAVIGDLWYFIGTRNNHIVRSKFFKEENRMKRNTLMLLVGMVIIASMVLAACQPTPAPVVEEPAPAEPVVQEPTKAPEAPVAEVPTEEPEPEPVRTTRKGGWLDEIVVSVVDNSSAITQIQAGAIDIYAAGMSSDALPEIEAAGLDYAQSNGLYYELTFNAYGPVFDSHELVS